MTLPRKAPIRLGIVGLGKIARDQHLPAIAHNHEYEIAFVADKAVRAPINAPHFCSLEAAIASGIEFDAVSLCTSPQPRLELCERLFPLNCSLLLEKPSAGTYEQAKSILAKAESNSTLVFAAWHSKFAPQVEVASAWLSKQTIVSGKIVWRENPAKWHPGQDWLWREGGFGVFDPGMNALSILTTILPDRSFEVTSGQLGIPENSETPTLASFLLQADETKINCEFEFHSHGQEIWDVSLTTADGSQLTLSEGGASVSINKEPPYRQQPREYDAIYKHFAQLICQQQNDFDIEPLRIIDAVFSNSSRTSLPPLDKSLFHPVSG
ncbi:MAG: Gfo/Idh/MocA family oxidoreductase [Pseudomonadota bacterium]